MYGLYTSPSSSKRNEDVNKNVNNTRLEEKTVDPLQISPALILGPEQQDVIKTEPFHRRWLHCCCYLNWSIPRQWLPCGYYETWSYSLMVAPLTLLQELVLLPDGGSTAAITRTDTFPSSHSTVAPLRPLPLGYRTDPIHRRWLHWEYLNWSCSRARSRCSYYKNSSYSQTVAPLLPIPELILQPGKEPLQLLQKFILFADGGSTAAITWTGPAARQWSRCGQSWWAGSYRRVSRYPVSSIRSVGYVLGPPHCKKKVVYSKNPTNPKKTKTMKPKKPTTDMPCILRCPSLLVNTNRYHGKK